MKREFGDRIKQERIRLGLNQTEFAAITGSGKTTVINWEKGETSPSLVQLYELSVVGLDVDFVLFGKKTSAAALSIKEIESEQGIMIDIEAYAFIPAYDVWASAGHGAESFDEPARRHLAFRKRWLELKGYNAKDLCAIFAKGDSMEPTIGDWTTLVINRTYNKPIDGRIFVIRQDSHLFVKRLQIQLGGSILLISDNPMYPPMQLSAADLQQVEIIGQVVHISRDV